MVVFLLHSSGMVQIFHPLLWGSVSVVQVLHQIYRRLTTTFLFSLCLMPVMRPPALSWSLRPTVRVCCILKYEIVSIPVIAQFN